MEAEYKTKCANCGEDINIGDEIEQDEDGNWVHEFHSDEPSYGYMEVGDY